jgi:hypothetical protein
MKNKIPSLVVVLVLTLLTAIAWVGFSVYRAISQKEGPVLSEDVTKDLSPSLNSEIIENMKNRIFLSENEIPETQIQASLQPSATPQVTVIPTPIASESPTTEPSLSPTPTPQEGETAQ